MVGQKFPNKTIHAACLFILASELLADVDISEGATKKKQTRGNKEMNTAVTNNSLLLIATSLVHVLTVILWHFTGTVIVFIVTHV